MTSEQNHLCEACGERAAAFCLWHHETGAARTLCGVCFERSASAEELALDLRARELVRHGRCEYCGQPATVAAYHYPAPSAATIELWCRRCALDLAALAREHSSELPDHFPEDSAARARLSAQLAGWEQRQQGLLQQRIRERR